MKTTINELVRSLADKYEDAIINAFKNHDREMVNIFVSAYNIYQENERDSVDYLFCVSNNKDIITCLKGGLEIKEVSELYLLSQMADYEHFSARFHFGVNHLTPKLLSTDELKDNLLSYACEVIENMLKYPHAYTSCQYQMFVTNHIV